MVGDEETAPRKRRRRPATTPEARENQLISLATDMAEKQMIAGTASAQVVVHYLKLATSRNKLEEEKIRLDNNLTEAKHKQIGDADNGEKKYDEVLRAMRTYSGVEMPEPDEY